MSRAPVFRLPRGLLRRISVAVHLDAHRRASTPDFPSPRRAAIVAHRHDMIISPDPDHDVLRRPPVASAPLEDVVADTAAGLVSLDRAVDADDAARAGCKPFIAPWNRTDDRPLVQHLLDVAADILGVDQPLLEGIGVEREHVL